MGERTAVDVGPIWVFRIFQVIGLARSSISERSGTSNAQTPQPSPFFFLRVLMGLFTRKKKSKDLITPLPPPSPPPDDFLVHQHAPQRPPQQQPLGPPPLAHQPQQQLLQQPPRLAHRQQQQSFVPLSTSRPRSRQLGRERVDSGPGGRAQWEGGAEEAGWDRRAPTVVSRSPLVYLRPCCSA